MKFKNPIIPGFHPDPSICRVGEDYYLVTSSFEYFPGVPIFHSKDLVHWRQIGYCLTRRSQLELEYAKNSMGIWAPTLRYYNGRFYMITTNVSHGGHFYVYTDDIYGEWSDPIWIEGDGHDPDIFFDDDGKVYILRHNGYKGITMWEMDIETGYLKGEPKYIWQGWEDKQCEAPHIYKINGKYYLITAEGGTWKGHMVTIARSDKIDGPYEGCHYNPILTHRHLVGHPVQSTGHGDLVQAHDGSWWMVFLATRPVNYQYHHLGRETFLAPVTWKDDGWPIVNDGKPIEINMEVETSLPVYIVEPENSKDDFNSDKLHLCWNFRRNPSDEYWSLKERPGFLAIRGDRYTLDDVEFKSFIGRRQEHFNCSVKALMVFLSNVEGDEAGLTIFANEEHHYEIGIIVLNGIRKIIVRKRIGDVKIIEYCEPIEKGDVILNINATRTDYHIGYSIDGVNYKVVAKAMTRYISEEVADSYTGTYIAMYSTGNGKMASCPVYFDWFEYVEKEE
ncbi:Xylan 1,4-beta-xylosidase [Thermoanaerobacterium xylanolyticum LX-11]|uniref:Xylan 1,4-beta-xylosidase n=1 Tax=Thermoanaerobacterium xylanolyticum (strain ATCC 49914 / DSM 7097 / LX-11) TaxID=858215 RepID=F6BKE0_THEXL|nr:glycoside hydrolase family 43 protein [Thermoanaerobacterium xylanolyticum]AEF18087.1 Xylan 1,4-beta-xylosidase [Thermoanaerobacterium xylanolyticum LX-11]